MQKYVAQAATRRMTLADTTGIAVLVVNTRSPIQSKFKSMPVEGPRPAYPKWYFSTNWPQKALGAVVSW